MRPQVIPYRHICFDYIIHRIHDVFFDAQLSRSRNFFIRFDLFFPQDYQGDLRLPHISNFMRRFQYSAHDEPGCRDVYYLAVREQESSTHPHYHLFFLLDGHYTQNIYGHMDRVRRTWNLTLGLDPEVNHGLVQYRPHQENNGIMLRRGSLDLQELTEDCIKQAFYLAKVNSKLTTGRNLFNSQVPRRPPQASPYIFPSKMLTRAHSPSHFPVS